MPDERDIDPVHIGDRAVGPGEPAYVIAEAGANHDGELAKAKRLVDAAVESGADAVKFQNYTAERLVTRDAPKYWDEGTQYETFTELDVLEREDYEAMAAYARHQDLMYLSTPFDGLAVDLLDDLDVPAYKIASGDLTHHPLLRDVASRGEPVILSTGMATLEEIRAAVGVIEDAGNDDIVLLHCITRYPTDIGDANLRMMSTLMREFDHPVGLSDHTIGTTVPVAAAAMGAAVIEKHFTYDTSLEKSPDHRLSADVEVMSEIVDRTREVHAAMGRAEQGPTEVEADGMRLARRSLVTDRAIEAGERIRRTDLAVKRPGTGLAPKLLFEVDEGEWRATRDLDADTVLTATDVEGLPTGAADDD
ncbi:N-acetylneuraminate synthase family protein [Haloglomus litoreum]|uniref:N-acetylneuraminate synthase family protein n=1 Tax=Haloglomus litoreum TaxID=3034026 RepID=UPI0023E77C5B|nr:N-acetylneuraminate synthase family protein [Haloglomus sp. DT116]